jgi:hypothetical protein
MAACPEKLHGRAEFAEGGAQQVTPGDHVVRQPEPVDALLKIRNRSHTDASPLSRAEWGERGAFG